VVIDCGYKKPRLDSPGSFSAYKTSIQVELNFKSRGFVKIFASATERWRMPGKIVKLKRKNCKIEFTKTKREFTVLV
jgi:hypothetical protein